MKRLWTAVAVLGLLSATSASYAQKEQDKNKEQERVSENQSEKSSDRKKSDRDQNREDKRSSSEKDDEYRLRYDGEDGRLKIEVDEEIRLRDAQNRKNKQPITRDGELDLRYDSDRHDLKASGEGTIDVEQAANSMGRWWQSWWEEEKTARRSRQEGAESGARHFVREHDANDDGYLSQRELPARHREDFARVDRNDDGYLSRDEVRRFGDELYGRQRSTTGNSTTRNISQANNQDQTWSEWWAAWWSSEDRAGADREGMTMQGAREFIRKHDRNDDGVIMRSEMPDRMYDEFDRLDANDDRRVTASELAARAPRADQARSNDARRSR